MIFSFLMNLERQLELQISFESELTSYFFLFLTRLTGLVSVIDAHEAFKDGLELTHRRLYNDLKTRPRGVIHKPCLLSDVTC